MNLLPLKQDDSGTLVTQYAMNPVGDLGLLKMDFLGLKTLTVIRNTCEMVKRTQGIEIDIDHLPLDDQKTYDLLNRAETLGVFQLESGGMRDLCRKFQISSVEHITALVALYRPGPMELIPEFIKRRHGEVKIEYEHPLLEPIARETYGILIYQEQVMQAAQVLAGYTLGGADLLRRAMGKKKARKWQKQRDDFRQGLRGEKQNSRSEGEPDFRFAGKIRRLRLQQIARRRLRHRRVSDRLSEGELSGRIFLRHDDQRHGGHRQVEPIHRRSARIRHRSAAAGRERKPACIFAAGARDRQERIRFGLAAIKGVGEVAVETILKARNEGGKFKSLSDLCERVDGRTVNRKILEALIKSGACDCFGQTRATLFAQIERTLARAASILSDKQKGQSSLFGALEEKAPPMPEAISNLPEWPQHELLAHEKELLGFYVTGHPLTPFAPILEKYALANTAKLAELPNRTLTRIGGLIAAVQNGVSKKSGKPYSMVTLEDLEGSVQVLVHERELRQIPRVA